MASARTRSSRDVRPRSGAAASVRGGDAAGGSRRRCVARLAAHQRNSGESTPLAAGGHLVRAAQSGQRDGAAGDLLARGTGGTADRAGRIDGPGVCGVGLRHRADRSRGMDSSSGSGLRNGIRWGVGGSSGGYRTYLGPNPRPHHAGGEGRGRRGGIEGVIAALVAAPAVMAADASSSGGLPDWVTLLITLIVALGGGGGMYQILTIRATKRNVSAGTDKMKVDAVDVLTGTALELIVPLKEEVARLSQQVKTL